MQADAVALAVGKQGDGANIIRQRQRAEDTGPTRRGNALQRGGKMISMQINNSALRRGRDTFKFGQRAAGGRILMWNTASSAQSMVSRRSDTCITGS